MKITTEILKVLGFVKNPDNSYEMSINSYLFTIKKDGPYKWSFSYDEVIHSIDSVEEMLAHCVGDGFDSGYKKCKKDFRDFLEI